MLSHILYTVHSIDLKLKCFLLHYLLILGGFCACLQYLGVALLLHALQRSRTPVVLQLPSRRELSATLDTFGLLSLYYFCKNASYIMLQVSGRLCKKAG